MGTRAWADFLRVCRPAFRRGRMMWVLLWLSIGSRADANFLPPPDTAQVLHCLARAKALRDHNLDSARYYDQLALTLAQRQGYQAGEARAELGCGNGLYRAGSYPGAQRHYEAAVRLARRTRQPLTEGHAYNGLALVAQALGNVPGAIAYLHQARAAYAVSRPYDPAREVTVLTNLGNTYLLAGQPEQAAAPLRQALAHAQPGLSPAILLNLLDLVGIVQQHQHHPDLAVATWRRELALALATGNRRAEGYARSNLAGTLLRQHQPRAALRYAQQAQQLARAQGDLAQLTDNTRVLAQALHALGRPDAFDTLSRFVARHDSLQGQARAVAVAQAQARFDVVQAREQVRSLTQRQRITALEVAQQRLHSQVLLGAGALGLLLLAGAVLAGYRRRQQRREAALRHQLAADLHDDVGTLLSQIAVQTDLLQEGLASPSEQHAQWAEVAGRSRLAVRQLNDVVWNLDAHNDTVPDLLNRLRDYAHEVLVPTGRQVRFVADDGAGSAPAALPALVRRQLYFVFKEALHNVLKYAPTTATVTVTLREQGSRLLLAVENDGPVLAPAGRSSGHGLRNMQARARALGGQATAAPRAQGGFGVWVEVPVG